MVFPLGGAGFFLSPSASRIPTSPSSMIRWSNPTTEVVTTSVDVAFRRRTRTSCCLRTVLIVLDWTRMASTLSGMGATWLCEGGSVTTEQARGHVLQRLHPNPGTGPRVTTGARRSSSADVVELFPPDPHQVHCARRLRFWPGVSSTLRTAYRDRSTILCREDGPTLYFHATNTLTNRRPSTQSEWLARHSSSSQPTEPGEDQVEPVAGQVGDAADC